MVTSAKFWDKAAEKYSKSPIKDMDAYEQTMDRTKAHLSKDDRVLEMGCGTGSTALLLADSVDHITATDISANMVDIGRNKAKDQQVANVDFVQATPSDHPFEKGTFDTVLTYNFLHLLEDAPQAVAEIKTLLKPGGLFISKTVCLNEKRWFLRPVIFVMQLFGFAPHVSFLSIKNLEGMITQAGFEIVETGLYPESWSSRFIVAKKV